MLMLFSTIVLLTLVGCGKSVDAETSSYYSSKAEEVILLLNQSDFEPIAAQFDDTMKAQLSIEQLGQITPYLTESGDYVGIKKSTVQEKDGYFVCVLVVEYSEKNRIITVSYNAQDQIAGLFVQ